MSDPCEDKPGALAQPPDVDIDRWIPHCWEDVVGNHQVKVHLRNMVAAIRQRGAKAGGNTMVIGESRSGKTSIIKLFVRCLLCLQLNDETLTPCERQCKSCKERDALYGLHGFYVELQDRRAHYVPIDCTRITSAELSERLTELRDFDGLRIVYLDELHRLQPKMQEQLLKPLDERSFLWLASTAKPRSVELMLRNRFTLRACEKPDLGSFAQWLAGRCSAWGIKVDRPGTLIRLAELSRGVPGSALQAISYARFTPDRIVTAGLVEAHRFPIDDE